MTLVSVKRTPDYECPAKQTGPINAEMDRQKKYVVCMGVITLSTFLNVEKDVPYQNYVVCSAVITLLTLDAVKTTPIPTHCLSRNTEACQLKQ